MADRELYPSLRVCRNAPVRRQRLPGITLAAPFLLLTLASTSRALGREAEDPEGKKIRPVVSTEVSLTSKYVWRGQRLTDDWSLQPSATVGLGKLSVNVWGTMDLTAVNQGDSLFLPDNPAAPAGTHHGLQGRFSEVDYTFSLARHYAGTFVEGGAIVYTFPHRGDSLASTVEVYGGITFEEVPLSPILRVFVDVDEARRAGDPGLYVQALAGRSLQFRGRVFPAVDISASVAFVNSGFGNAYYGTPVSGLHDVNLRFTLPFCRTEKVSAAGFVSFSGLVGEFRNFQARNLRDVYRGSAGGPASYADTVWGGLSVSLFF